MSYAETLKNQSESLLSSAQQGIDKAREYADYEKASGFLFPHPLGKVGPLPLRRVVTIISSITLAFSIFQIFTAMSFPGLIVAVARFGVGVVGLIAAYQKQESTSKMFAYAQALLLTISSLLLVSAVFFAIIRIGFSVFSFVVLVISIITVGFDYFAAWVASSYYEALRRGVSVESQA
ncbi:uncharacterized protein ELE39_000198 [Cryptosporidium sp. chipmunk genotype I]|uniref:uncharacterized protein n=1 Tax=Cryptosporidium sp. chipmunk genotype I TaxID=1280935 RepID=UPI00351A6124|nr:hypothetical protein ELE39_000198 [Cryptosporidium sp. chipmunk genotype I]